MSVDLREKALFISFNLYICFIEFVSLFYFVSLFMFLLYIIICILHKFMLYINFIKYLFYISEYKEMLIQLLIFHIYKTVVAIFNLLSSVKRQTHS